MFDNLKINTLDDLAELKLSDPALFSDISQRSLKVLSGRAFQLGLYDPGDFPQSFPESASEFRSNVKEKLRNDPELLDFYSRIILSDIQEAEIEARCARESPRDWCLEQFENVDDRVRFEILKSSGILQRYLDGNVARDVVVTFMVSAPLFREDYMNCTVLRPKDFPALVEKYGIAVITNSLLDDNALKTSIEGKLAELTAIFSDTPETMLRHAGPFRRANPAGYALAKELFARFEWARSEIIPKVNYLDTSKVLNLAFRAFIDEGKEAATDVLREYRLRPAQVSRILESFKEKTDQFLGFNNCTSTSEFERGIEGWIKDQKLAYRRQVLYSEILNTNRSFRMDFLLEAADGSQIVVEVTSGLDDEFVHTQAYRERMRVKQELTEKAGAVFVEISEFDRWRDELLSFNPKRGVAHGVYDQIKPVNLSCNFEWNDLASSLPQRITLNNSHKRIWAFVENPYVAAAVARRA